MKEPEDFPEEPEGDPEDGAPEYVPKRRYPLMRQSREEARPTKWKEFMGWVCAVAVLYTLILRPFWEWAGRCIAEQDIAVPQIDTDALMLILSSLLGFSFGAFKSIRGGK